MGVGCPADCIGLATGSGEGDGAYEALGRADGGCGVKVGAEYGVGVARATGGEVAEGERVAIGCGVGIVGDEVFG